MIWQNCQRKIGIPFEICKKKAFKKMCTPTPNISCQIIPKYEFMIAFNMDIYGYIYEYLTLYMSILTVITMKNNAYFP